MADPEIPELLAELRRVGEQVTVYLTTAQTMLAAADKIVARLEALAQVETAQ